MASPRSSISRITLVLCVAVAASSIWLWSQRDRDAERPGHQEPHAVTGGQGKPRPADLSAIAGETATQAPGTAPKPEPVRLPRYRVCDGALAPEAQLLSLSNTRAPWLAIHCGSTVHLLGIPNDAGAAPLRLLRANAQPPRPELTMRATRLIDVDINGDDRDDLIVPYIWNDAHGAAIGGSVYQLLREPSGSFAAPRPLAAVAARAIGNGRFVSDKPLDLALVHAGNPATAQPDELVIFRGGPSPMKALATSVGTETYASASADLDRDGRDELALVSKSGVEVLAFAQDGSIRERKVLDMAGARAVFATDLDGDGHSDLAFEGHAVHALFATASAMPEPRQLVALDDVSGIAPADVNGDGKLDLVGRTTSAVVAFVQTGAGQFERRTLVASATPLALVAALPFETAKHVGVALVTRRNDEREQTTVELSFLHEPGDAPIVLDDQPSHPVQDAALSLTFDMR
jgi:hypothetical protein